MKIPTEQEMKLYDEYHSFNALDRYQEMRKRNKDIKVLALDLEWTLISEVHYPTPRTGLFGFLEAVKQLFERVVLFTAATEDLFRKAAQELVANKEAPEWFADIEYIQWPRTGYKDLSFIPGIESHQALLVDDHMPYVHPSQLFQWIPIPGYRFWNDYFDDHELDKILGILELIMLDTIKKKRVLAYLQPYVDDSGSCIKKLWLYGPVAKGNADSKSTIKIAMEIDNAAEEEWLSSRSRRNGQGTFIKAQKKFDWYFWAKVELASYAAIDFVLKEKINDEAILILNTWDRFNAVFTRTQDGIEIEFPDLPGCVALCRKPENDDGYFDNFTIQALGPARDALEEWIGSAGKKAIPEKKFSREKLRKKYPDASSIPGISVRLPWLKKRN